MRFVMLTLTQPSLLLVAYAAGVLMFFSPCSVGLLPAYLTYFTTAEQDSPSTHTTPSGASPRNPAALVGGLLGGVIFLLGAVPLFYMAVAGIRIQLPGYHAIVPLAQLGTGSYLPPVGAVTVGTLLLANSAVLAVGLHGIYIAVVVTLGVVSTYLVVGLPVIVFGQWVKSYLAPLELLAGPLIIAIGFMYYKGTSIPAPRLPRRDGRSTAAFFSFGVIYGLGSLACNLPVFLGVIIPVFATDGVLDGLAVFAAFALGMSTLMIGVTVFTAATGRSVSFGRYAGRIRVGGSIVFVVLGSYITWYTLESFAYI